MEVVGTVAAVQGLIASALGIYRHINSSKGFGDTADRLSALIRLQFYRFEVWLEQSGYGRFMSGGAPAQQGFGDPFTLPSSPVLQRVHEAIAQMLVELNTLEKLLKKYQLPVQMDKRLDSGDFSMEQQPPNISAHLMSLPVHPKELVQQTSATARQRAQLNRRVSKFRKVTFGWSLSNDMSDSERIKELIETLTTWNDALRELLPIYDQKANSLFVQVKSVGSNPDEQDLQSLETCSRALNGLPYSDILESAKLKRLRLSLIRDDEQSSQVRIPPLEKSRLSTADLRAASAQLTPLTLLTESSIDAPDSNDPVMLDYMDLSQQISQEDQAIILNRVQDLCGLFSGTGRPSASVIPICEGYIEEGHGRFCLVYRMPPQVLSKSIQADTLYRLLPSNAHNVRHAQQSKILPALEDRRRLAYQLSGGLLQLLSIDWVHKALNSDNVLLLRPNKDERLHNLLDNPLLFGFGLGRVDNSLQQTIDLRGFKPEFNIYQHPELQTNVHCRYKRRHDIFSLGMILFEIGIWQNLHYFNPQGASSPEHFRLKIINTARKHLAHTMGRRYLRVVLACINDDQQWERLEEEEAENPGALLEHFSWKIVRELSHLSTD